MLQKGLLVQLALAVSLFLGTVSLLKQPSKTEQTDQSSDLEQNRAPVIGVITQLLRDYTKFGDEKKLHLPSSYVKWVESAGGRVLPIFLNQNDEYYENVFNLTNGLLFPGGDNMLQPALKTPMLEAAKKLYKLAVKSNDDGSFYPIWGTCLGFELLAVLTSRKNSLFNCNAHDIMLRVEGIKRGRLFAKDPLGKGSFKVFKNIDYPEMVYGSLQSHNLSYNYHRKCIVDDEAYKLNGLDKFYDIIAYSYDKNNQKFISIFEARKYPFFGVQFHPEKAPFEFTHNTQEQSVDHSEASIEVSRYFADFFINLAKQNDRKSTSSTIDTKLIYNFSPKYTGVLSDMYLQRYLFPFTPSTENSEIEFINGDE